MRLKISFEFVEMDNEIIAVPIGEDADKIRGVIKLNPSGKEILELLKDETSEEKVVDSLSQKYENNRDSLAEYVREMIEKMNHLGVLI